MKLGIDLGTTRTLVACVDRGNYPVVGFVDADGDAHEHFPSVIAAHAGTLVYGFDALRAARDGAPVLRSFKRALASPDVTAETLLHVGDVEIPLMDAMVGFLRALHEALRDKERTNLPRKKGAAAAQKRDDDEVVAAVPAHAHAAQRFLTIEAFRRAGFAVKALVNEPSAAGFEYTHRQGKTVTSKRTRVVVYDLGGGTFDASLVRVDGEHHDVVATAGVNRLGGDDFDDALLDCALDAAHAKRTTLDPTTIEALRDACRDAKERLTPQAKKIAIASDDLDVTISVEEFYERAAPLVERSMHVMRPLLGAIDDEADELTDIAGIYLVGGASQLPLIPRVLKERFGRRVHKSPYPAASTAIGLALAADDAAGFSLTDRVTRSFGVFRESAGGRALRFDPIFLRDTPLPKGGLVVSRRYRAAHNIGHYRFVECGGVDDAGDPTGDLVPFGEALFAFDPLLRARGASDLRAQPVMRCDDGPVIEERYAIDQGGLVEVSIVDVASGFGRTFRLGA